VIAVTLIPTKMREVQVEVADVAVDAAADGEHGVEGPSTPPVPVPAPD
jgi:hypothetical protein